MQPFLSWAEHEICPADTYHLLSSAEYEVCLADKYKINADSVELSMKYISLYQFCFSLTRFILSWPMG